MIDVIDVSHHQDPAKFDWPGLTKRGVRGVVARATYGKDTADRDFVEFAKRVRGEGLAFGAYLFYRQVHSVEDQLALWERQLERVGGLVPGDFLPVLDMEHNGVNGDGSPRPKVFAPACETIAKAWVEQYGGAVLYYSSYFPEYLKNFKTWMQTETLFKHWLADYGTGAKASVPGAPRTPYTKAWHLHQYAGDHPPGRVPEYAGGRENVDLNALNPAVDFSELLIQPGDDGVSEEARECERGTDARPGGADRGTRTRAAALIREGLSKITAGLGELEPG